MPNRVYFTDERTSFKVMRALTQDGAMDLEQALDTVDRLQGNGLQIVENAPKGATATPSEGE